MPGNTGSGSMTRSGAPFAPAKSWTDRRAPCGFRGDRFQWKRENFVRSEQLLIVLNDTVVLEMIHLKARAAAETVRRRIKEFFERPPASFSNILPINRTQHFPLFADLDKYPCFRPGRVDPISKFFRIKASRKPVSGPTFFRYYRDLVLRGRRLQLRLNCPPEWLGVEFKTIDGDKLVVKLELPARSLEIDQTWRDKKTRFWFAKMVLEPAATSLAIAYVN